MSYIFHIFVFVGEDSFFYRNEEGAVILYNCSTNISSVFMDNTTFVSMHIQNCLFYNSDNQCLFVCSKNHIFVSIHHARKVALVNHTFRVVYVSTIFFFFFFLSVSSFWFRTRFKQSHSRYIRLRNKDVLQYVVWRRLNFCIKHFYLFIYLFFHLFIFFFILGIFWWNKPQLIQVVQQIKPNQKQ